VILLPTAVALGYFLPVLITPLLMIGGTYLCYEGAEKIFAALFPHRAHQHENTVHQSILTPQQLEDKTVLGAIQTDFILSAEIMAISLSTIQDATLIAQMTVLVLISIVLTVGVYGVVALIVKMDDVGMVLAASRNGPSLYQNIINFMGRGLVLAMPKVLFLLTVIGTAAMTWVGGSILVHGAEVLGWPAPSHVVHDFVAQVSQWSPPYLTSIVSWLTASTLQALIGILVGLLTIPVVESILAPLIARFRKQPRIVK
jgi:predicted DNA repair protein MutK